MNASGSTVSVSVIAAYAAAARTAADEAEAAASAAELFASSAATAAGMFLTTAEGLAATSDGDVFSVVTAGTPAVVTIYRNDNGSAVLMGQQSSLGEIVDYTIDGSAENLSLTIGGRGADGNLYEMLSFLLDGTLRSGALEAFVSLMLGGMQISSITAAGWGPFVFAQEGEDGNLYALFGMLEDGTIYAPGTASNVAEILYHMPVHGQSNAAGDEAEPAISTADTGWGSYKFARGYITWISTDNPTTPELRADADFKFIALRASGLNETRANGLADSYKARLIWPHTNDTARAAGPHVLITFAGLGSRGIKELGPEDDAESGNVGAVPPGGFWNTLKDDIVRAKAQAEALGMEYICPGWFWDQGERESAGLIYRYLPEYDLSVARQMYQAEAELMVAEFDDYVRTVNPSQTRPVPLFVTPPHGPIITTSAWVDLIDHPLVYVVGPRYQFPSAVNSSSRTGASQRWGNFLHMCADGQRGTGDNDSKVAYRVFERGEDWKPLYATSAVKVDSTHADVTFNVPRSPMVPDTENIPKMRGFGFSVYSGTIDLPVGEQWATAYEVRAPGNVVRFTFATAIPANAFVRIGVSQRIDMGFTPTVVSQAAGAATVHGFATTEYRFAGDLTDDIATITQEGAFYVTGLLGGQATIRTVTYDSGTSQTVMNGETRDITGGGIANADQVNFTRISPAINLRDSDSEGSLYTFVEGPRTGESYKLWNWCMPYDALAIQGT